MRHCTAFCDVLSIFRGSRRRCALFWGTHPSRGIRRCALSAWIRSRHASVAAAHAHRMPCRVPGLPQNRAHRLRFTRAPTSAPSARRSGGGDAVSRDAKCAEEASLRRVAAQIAKQSSARAKRSGRKEPRMRRGISARRRGAGRRAERAAHEGRDPRNSATPQRRTGSYLVKCKGNAVQ